MGDIRTRADGTKRSWGLVLRKPFGLTLVRYGFALVTVAAALVVRKVLEPFTGTGAPFVLFFAAVTVSAVLAGSGPGMFATLLSVPIGAYLFVVRAGYPFAEAASQATLFTFDGLVVVYLSLMVDRARRSAEILGARQRDLDRVGARRVLPGRPGRSLHGRQPERLSDARVRT